MRAAKQYGLKAEFCGELAGYKEFVLFLIHRAKGLKVEVIPSMDAALIAEMKEFIRYTDAGELDELFQGYRQISQDDTKAIKEFNRRVEKKVLEIERKIKNSDEFKRVYKIKIRKQLMQKIGFKESTGESDEPDSDKSEGNGSEKFGCFIFLPIAFGAVTKQSDRVIGGPRGQLLPPFFFSFEKAFASIKDIYRKRGIPNRDTTFGEFVSINIWRHTWVGHRNFKFFKHKDRISFGEALYEGLEAPGVLIIDERHYYTQKIKMPNKRDDFSSKDPEPNQFGCFFPLVFGIVIAGSRRDGSILIANLYPDTAGEGREIGSVLMQNLPAVLMDEIGFITKGQIVTGGAADCICCGIEGEGWDALLHISNRITEASMNYSIISRYIEVAFKAFALKVAEQTGKNIILEGARSVIVVPDLTEIEDISQLSEFQRDVLKKTVLGEMSADYKMPTELLRKLVERKDGWSWNFAQRLARLFVYNQFPLTAVEIRRTVEGLIKSLKALEISVIKVDSHKDWFINPIIFGRNGKHSTLQAHKSLEGEVIRKIEMEGSAERDGSYNKGKFGCFIFPLILPILGMVSGGDGFVFIKWRKEPLVLAKGIFAKVKVLNDYAMEGNIVKKLSDTEIAEVNSKLNKVKRKILEEQFFREDDFDVEVIVDYLAYKSATFEKTSQKRKDKIHIDLRSFKNPNFLYIVIKHELTDLKLKSIFPKIDPALRELFTLLTVNITEFMNLRDKSLRGAKKLLRDYDGVANERVGLFSRYRKINARSLLNEPLYFVEDICRMVAGEAAYFPNMQNRMKKLAFKNNKLRSLLMPFIRIIINNLRKSFTESKYIIGEEELRPLTALENEREIPRALIPFMPYARNIYYKTDDDNNIFLKVKFRAKDGKIKYAHLCFGQKDDLDSVLGSRGRLFDLTYKDWQKNNPAIFHYEYDGIEKERGYCKSRLIRLKLTKMIKQIKNYNLSRKGEDIEERFRNLFSQFFEELNIDISQLSKRTWLSIQKQIGKNKGPNAYYVIRDAFIENYLDRLYPKLFLGEIDVTACAIRELKIWAVIENPNMRSSLTSWMIPNKRRGPPSFYIEAEKISISELLDLLSSEPEESDPKGSNSERPQDDQLLLFNSLHFSLFLPSQVNKLFSAVPKTDPTHPGSALQPQGVQNATTDYANNPTTLGCFLFLPVLPVGRQADRKYQRSLRNDYVINVGIVAIGLLGLFMFSQLGWFGPLVELVKTTGPGSKFYLSFACLPFALGVISSNVRDTLFGRGLNKDSAGEITERMIKSTGLKDIRVIFVRRLHSFGYSNFRPAQIRILEQVLKYIGVGQFTFLIGHEIGHHLIWRKLENIRSDRTIVRLYRLLNAFQTDSEILTYLMAQNNLSKKEARVLLNTIETEYCHSLEFEADKIGFKLMRQYGFNNDCAISLLRDFFSIFDSLDQEGCIIPLEELLDDKLSDIDFPPIAERIRRLEILAGRKKNLTGNKVMSLQDGNLEKDTEFACFFFLPILGMAKETNLKKKYADNLTGVLRSPLLHEAVQVKENIAKMKQAHSVNQISGNRLLENQGIRDKLMFRISGDADLLVSNNPISACLSLAPPVFLRKQKKGQGLSPGKSMIFTGPARQESPFFNGFFFLPIAFGAIGSNEKGKGKRTKIFGSLFSKKPRQTPQHKPVSEQEPESEIKPEPALEESEEKRAPEIDKKIKEIKRLYSQAEELIKDKDIKGAINILNQAKEKRQAIRSQLTEEQKEKLSKKAQELHKEITHIERQNKNEEKIKKAQKRSKFLEDLNKRLDEAKSFAQKLAILNRIKEYKDLPEITKMRKQLKNEINEKIIKELQEIEIKVAQGRGLDIDNINNIIARIEKDIEAFSLKELLEKAEKLKERIKKAVKDIVIGIENEFPEPMSTRKRIKTLPYLRDQIDKHSNKQNHSVAEEIRDIMDYEIEMIVLDIEKIINSKDAEDIINTVFSNIYKIEKIKDKLYKEQFEQIEELKRKAEKEVKCQELIADIREYLCLGSDFIEEASYSIKGFFFEFPDKIASIFNDEFLNDVWPHLDKKLVRNEFGEGTKKCKKDEIEEFFITFTSNKYEQEEEAVRVEEEVKKQAMERKIESSVGFTKILIRQKRYSQAFKELKALYRKYPSSLIVKEKVLELLKEIFEKLLISYGADEADELFVETSADIALKLFMKGKEGKIPSLKRFEEDANRFYRLKKEIRDTRIMGALGNVNWPDGLSFDEFGGRAWVEQIDILIAIGEFIEANNRLRRMYYEYRYNAEYMKSAVLWRVKWMIKQALKKTEGFTLEMLKEESIERFIDAKVEDFETHSLGIHIGKLFKECKGLVLAEQIDKLLEKSNLSEAKNKLETLKATFDKENYVDQALIRQAEEKINEKFKEQEYKSKPWKEWTDEIEGLVQRQTYLINANVPVSGLIEYLERHGNDSTQDDLEEIKEILNKLFNVCNLISHGETLPQWLKDDFENIEKTISNQAFKIIDELIKKKSSQPSENKNEDTIFSWKQQKKRIDDLIDEDKFEDIKKIIVGLGEYIKTYEEGFDIETLQDIKESLSYFHNKIWEKIQEKEHFEYSRQQFKKMEESAGEICRLDDIVEDLIRKKEAIEDFWKRIKEIQDLIDQDKLNEENYQLVRELDKKLDTSGGILRETQLDEIGKFLNKLHDMCFERIRSSTEDNDCAVKISGFIVHTATETIETLKRELKGKQSKNTKPFNCLIFIPFALLAGGLLHLALGLLGQNAGGLEAMHEAFEPIVAHARQFISAIDLGGKWALAPPQAIGTTLSEFLPGNISGISSLLYFLPFFGAVSDDSGNNKAGQSSAFFKLEQKHRDYIKDNITGKIAELEDALALDDKKTCKDKCGEIAGELMLNTEKMGDPNNHNDQDLITIARIISRSIHYGISVFIAIDRLESLKYIDVMSKVQAVVGWSYILGHYAELRKSAEELIECLKRLAAIIELKQIPIIIIERGKGIPERAFINTDHPDIQKVLSLSVSLYPDKKKPQEKKRVARRRLLPQIKILPKKVIYRLPTLDELNAVTMAHNLGWSGSPEEWLTVARVKKRIETNPKGIVVAEINGEIVGVIFSITIQTYGDFSLIPYPLSKLIAGETSRFHNKKGDTKVIYSVAVAAEGKGIAIGLKNMQSELSKLLGITYSVTHSPDDAQGFHEHLGADLVFKIEDGRRKGKDAVIMNYTQASLTEA
ncbi:MAG: M48 family metalloprotease, partial [Candidatus Omnitrophica bacterium]|nr:M48 family metalloprotease [Candidatus Omnitrophota bacterium]